MKERFFVEEPICGDRAVLTTAEAHHLSHVLRARRGDEVILFDGTGSEFTATIENIGRSRVELRIGSTAFVDRELPFSLTIGVSLPRGDRQKWLSEKLSELGATRLVPILAERTFVEPGEGAIERLRRAAIEAAKQCGRNRLLRIESAMPLERFLVEPPRSATRLVLHPQREEPAPALSVREGEVYVAVGPEGGFTDKEFQRCLELSWTAVDLGPRILRIETAAIAIAAKLSGFRPSS